MIRIIVCSSGQRAGCQPLRHEEDGGTGHAGHCPAHLKRFSAEVRAASGAKTRVLYASCGSHIHLYRVTGKNPQIVWSVYK
jgi:hypothetical protein